MNSFLKEKNGDDSHGIKSEYAGHVEVSKITDDRRLTQSEASSIVSDTLGISKSDLSEYMKSNNLTWHECGDGKTVRCVPTEINSVYGHTGGIGLSKDTKAVASVFKEDRSNTNEEITAKDWVEENKDQIKEARKESGKDELAKDNAISKATSLNNSTQKQERSEKNNSISKATNKEIRDTPREQTHDISHDR